MLDIKDIYVQSVDRRAEGFSAWLWLGFPIATAVVLSFLGRAEPDFYDAWVHGEKGLLEMSQAAVMVVAAILGLFLLVLPVVRQWPALFGWVFLATAGSFYVAGEELSWGQHLLNWSTPEYWGAINDQNETNLHNISSWLDQKPRALLEIGVIFGGIVLPLAALYYTSIRTSWIGIIVPPFLCLPSAVLAEAIRLFERVADWTGGDAGALFIRPAEYQEFYFYLFVLFYLIVLGQRLRALQAHLTSLSEPG
ncbi:MAG: hypothetical protein ACFCUT_12070 [Kiloniellaceae bacterium]